MKSPNFDNVKAFCALTELSVDVDTDNSVYITGLNDNGLHIGWVGSKEKAIAVLKSMRDLFSTNGAISKSICITPSRFNVANLNPTVILSVAATESEYILHESYQVSDVSNMIPESTQYFMNRFDTFFPQDRINVIVKEINELIKFIEDDGVEPEYLSEDQLRLKAMLLGIKVLSESKIEDIIRANSEDCCKKALSRLNGLFYAHNIK